MAMQGEITGCSLAFVDGAGSTFNQVAPGCAQTGAMMLSVHSLHTRMTRWWYGAENEVTEDRGGAG